MLKPASVHSYWIKSQRQNIGWSRKEYHSYFGLDTGQHSGLIAWKLCVLTWRDLVRSSVQWLKSGVADKGQDMCSAWFLNLVVSGGSVMNGSFAVVYFLVALGLHCYTKGPLPLGVVGLFSCPATCGIFPDQNQTRVPLAGGFPTTDHQGVLSWGSWGYQIVTLLHWRMLHQEVHLPFWGVLVL